jgi:TM2 domain-containing membrane protein YozV
MPEMKFCYKCGEKIFEEAEICPKCGVRQKHPPGYEPKAGQQPATQGAQPGTPNPAPGTQNTQPQTYEEKKSPGLAAILSFFWCGLGHIYCGDLAFGIMLACLYPIVAFVCSITLICIPLIVLMWFWGIYDAYSLAQRINRGEVK